MRMPPRALLTSAMALACTVNSSPSTRPGAAPSEHGPPPPVAESAAESAAESVAESVVAPPEISQAQPIPWTDLKIWEAAISQSRPEVLYITEEAKTTPFPERELWGESVELPLDDRRIPTAIRELSPFVVSTSRAPLQLTAPQEIRFAQALYGGTYWLVAFDSGGLSGPMLALSHVVSPDMRLRAAPAPVVVPFEDPFIQRVAPRVPKRWAARLKKSTPRKLQLVTGSFPNDATTIVVVSVPDELSDESAMFTAKADGALVQELAVPTENTSPAGITVEFVADLDGDGFDEVGWSEQDIESRRYVLTHLTASGVEHQTLSDAGH